MTNPPRLGSFDAAINPLCRQEQEHVPLSRTHTARQLAPYEEKCALDWYRIMLKRWPTDDTAKGELGHQMGRLCKVRMYPDAWTTRCVKEAVAP